MKRGRKVSRKIAIREILLRVIAEILLSFGDCRKMPVFSANRPRGHFDDLPKCSERKLRLSNARRARAECVIYVRYDKIERKDLVDPA